MRDVVYQGPSDEVVIPCGDHEHYAKKGEKSPVCDDVGDSLLDQSDTWASHAKDKKNPDTKE